MAEEDHEIIDHHIIVPGDNTALIQIVHQAIIDILAIKQEESINEEFIKQYIEQAGQTLETVQESNIREGMKLIDETLSTKNEILLFGA